MCARSSRACGGIRSERGRTEDGDLARAHAVPANGVHCAHVDGAHARHRMIADALDAARVEAAVEDAPAVGTVVGHVLREAYIARSVTEVMTGERGVAE